MSLMWSGATLIVEAALDDDATSVDPTWTDITEHVRFPLTTYRGRTDAYSTFGVGTMSLVLSNRTRAFDPSNVDGPFYGKLLPMRRFRFRVEVGAGNYDVITAHALGYPMAFRGRGADVVVNLRCVDSTRILEQRPLPSSAVAAEILADGPLHYWPLQESDGGGVFADAVRSLDLSASGVTSRVDGRVPLGASSAVAVAPVVVNGVAVNTPTIQGTPFIAAEPRTLEAWTNFAEPTFGTARVAVYNARGFSPSQMWVGAGPEGRLIYAYQNDTDNVKALATSNVATPTGVHHLAVVADDTDLHLYVDGRLLESTSLTVGTIAQSNGPGVEILTATGADPNNTTEAAYFAHVATFEHSLSADRIKAHYEAGVRAWGHPYGERTGARAGRVLDDIGWPDAARSVDTGDTPHGTYIPAGQSALSYLRLLETAEDGMVYVDKSGNVAVRGRQHRWQPGLPLLVADDGTVLTGDDDVALTADDYLSFADELGEGVPVADVVIDQNSVDNLRNIVKATHAGGEVAAVDETSRDAFGGADLLLLVPTISSTELARQLAAYKLRVSKDPRTLLPSLTVKPRAGDGSSLASILSLELGDRVNVSVTPMRSGDPIALPVVVEGIRHNLPRGGEWSVDLYLSPADEGQYLVVGDATLGRIGADAGNRIPF